MKTPDPSAIKAYDPAAHPAQLVRRVHQRAAQLFTQAVQVRNLSVPQFVALVTLLKHGPMMLSQLGRLTSIDPATMTVVVRKLVKDGLVIKTTSETDQRVSVICLTECGETCARTHIPVSINAGESLLAPLTEDERRQFLALLRKILTADD
ncbi:MarR family winged helix-turn-helix transcriptional regulator [Paracoccus sp. MKU1]|uniref:MarR family winged helix-turn-helix transcriptional regulator n=1 Tax=Paracoccus sp. MKU1 TaxID=1745182 RepID=UPI00071918B9|nr:MarR family winged helix-turn-helix transcriptional regulator [Paracoccus sp. MKU1]KRW95161.1 hypothetical protein AQY21_16080 [Paracoccus sp. MKU1]